MHKSVLLKEIIENLGVGEGDVWVDMTLGGSGHSIAVLKKAQNSQIANLTLIGIDADSDATSRAEAELSQFPYKVIIENAYFDSLEDILVKHKISSISKIIFDLGFSSYQIDDPERGLSLRLDGPLNMSYSRNPQFTAYDVVNSWEEENLADIIFGFGEESFAKRIAKKIVERRETSPIKTTHELSEIIKSALPAFKRFGKIHPATKTFQAIRIAVNSELDRLQRALDASFKALCPGGKMAIISFHSLEDRIVKNFFKQKAETESATILTKKPIVPTDTEISENPRARSAKLRILEK